MGKKKLDNEHVFLQFLMMFLTLSMLLIFAVFVKNILWFDSAVKVISSLSWILFSFILLGVSFLKYRRTEEKVLLPFSFSLLILGSLMIFFGQLQSLSFSLQALITVVVTAFLFIFFLSLFRNKNWVYSNLDFWIIFALSLLIFSRVFFLENLLNESSKLLEYSHLINLFGYLALIVGFANEFHEEKLKLKCAKKRKKK